MTLDGEQPKWSSKCVRTGQHMDHEADFEPPLDPGIKRAVLILREEGVETYESCEGGQGHAYPEPAVRFYGDRFEGFRALGIALQHDLHVSSLRRIWNIIDGEPVGPDWEITFNLRSI